MKAIISIRRSFANHRKLQSASESPIYLACCSMAALSAVTMLCILTISDAQPDGSISGATQQHSWNETTAG